jgi:hypothetical protein
MSAKLKLLTLQQTQAGRYLPYPTFLYSSAFCKSFVSVEWRKSQLGAFDTVTNRYQCHGWNEKDWD